MSTPVMKKRGAGSKKQTQRCRDRGTPSSRRHDPAMVLSPMAEGDEVELGKFW